MNLQAARIAFTKNLGRLILKGDELGFKLLIDEVKRDPRTAKWNATHCRIRVEDGRRCEMTPEQHASLDHAFKPIGIEKSVHIQALAADIYIMVNGEISNDREGYATLGQFWKSLHYLARWGGDFEGFPDLGHFSFTWDGRA